MSIETLPVEVVRRRASEPLPPEETLFSSLFYDLTYFLTSVSMTVGWSIRTEGFHNVPRTGPVLFIANHQSYFDPVLVGLSTRRHLWYLARKTLFRNLFFRGLINTLNAVPVDQDGTGIEGLRIVLRLLQAGRAVIVYPEGGRTHDGTLQPLQPGVHLLMKKSRAPVVPIGIAGAFDAWSMHRLLPMPAPLFLPAQQGRIAVSIGPPLDVHHFAEMPRTRCLEELHAQMSETIACAERLRRRS